MGEKLLEVRNLQKYYGKTCVLHDINLTIEKGKIYGPVGANGSGKSTFMNILFGNRIIDETGGYGGDVFYEGEKVNIRSTKEAIEKGIGMIHQEFVLIPEMTVTENIKLTRENTKKGWHYIDKAKNNTDAEKVLSELGFDIDPSYLIQNLSVNAKQFVEIARELDKNDLKLLLLDEPTAVLNAEDAGKLMDVLKKLAKNGTSILFCTHRLHEICEICDYVTVFRDGEIVSDYKREELNMKQLAHDMIGYDVEVIKKDAGHHDEECIMSFSDFSVEMPGEPLKGINLDVQKGEILGLTSLSGHGKLAVGYGVMGMYPVSGKIMFQSEELHVSEVRNNIEKGVFLLPDDRKNMGLLLEHSICENITFSAYYGKNKFQKKVLGRFHIKDRNAIKEYAEKQIKQLEIKCENKEQQVKELSGGNQQKVCIARAVAADPKVLFIMEPTRGVDVGAKERILDMLVKINREQGTTIVIASSELDELKRISDRIVVFCEGHISQILPPNSPEDSFAYAYTGEGKENEE